MQGDKASIPKSWLTNQNSILIKIQVGLVNRICRNCDGLAEFLPRLVTGTI